ncbi:MAG: porin family protein [Gammaproteobacteria bacterium]|nr:porin family protein [Gammaproteobacteria bacterium]MCW8987436.1 porin family protein [Gammaproteobacteria bacterium]MCW9030287.1 porin family protein [Gammaproteobacteria bacterium]
MKGKILKLSAFIATLMISITSFADTYHNITLKTGQFTFGDKTQVIETAVLFDENSTSEFAIEYEIKLRNNLTFGGELIRYKNTFDTGSNNATGTHFFANFKKYFDVATHVQPFIGVGAGASTVRLSGSSSSGTAGDFGLQFMAGIKFPFEDISAVIEYKVISAEPSDDVGSSVDLSGDGLFAGLAINF